MLSTLKQGFPLFSYKNRKTQISASEKIAVRNSLSTNLPTGFIVSLHPAQLIIEFLCEKAA